MAILLILLLATIAHGMSPCEYMRDFVLPQGMAQYLLCRDIETNFVAPDGLDVPALSGKTSLRAREWDGGEYRHLLAISPVTPHEFAGYAHYGGSLDMVVRADIPTCVCSACIHWVYSLLNSEFRAIYHPTDLDYWAPKMLQCYSKYCHHQCCFAKDIISDMYLTTFDEHRSLRFLVPGKACTGFSDLYDQTYGGSLAWDRKFLNDIFVGKSAVQIFTTYSCTGKDPGFVCEHASNCTILKIEVAYSQASGRYDITPPNKYQHAISASNLQIDCGVRNLIPFSSLFLRPVTIFAKIVLSSTEGSLARLYQLEVATPPSSTVACVTNPKFHVVEMESGEAFYLPSVLREAYERYGLAIEVVDRNPTIGKFHYFMSGTELKFYGVMFDTNDLVSSSNVYTPSGCYEYYRDRQFVVPAACKGLTVEHTGLSHGSYDLYSFCAHEPCDLDVRVNSSLTVHYRLDPCRSILLIPSHEYAVEGYKLWLPPRPKHTVHYVEADSRLDVSVSFFQIASLLLRFVERIIQFFLNAPSFFMSVSILDVFAFFITYLVCFQRFMPDHAISLLALVAVYFLLRMSPTSSRQRYAAF